MVLHNVVFLVLSTVAYGTSLNVNLDGNARTNSESQLLEQREIYAEGSAQLELYILCSRGHKERLGDEETVQKYLSEFVKKINEIFSTQKEILNVNFQLVKTGLWDPKNKPLKAELLKKELEEYATNLDTEWSKEHPGVPISAFLFLTTETIMNETGDTPTVAGISGRIGGICLTGEKVAAATDDANYSGVRDAARQLSRLMGAVYDGESPPGSEFVSGSDGAQDCNPKDGFLMGEWGTDQKSFSLSECSSYQFIFGLRQRGPRCYGTPEEKKKQVKNTK